MEAPPVALTPPPIATRQTTFSIPFRLELGGDRPSEVQLRVSEDQGANWTVSARVRPEQGSFVFRAARDGEYWFSIRTVDRAGQLQPNSPPTPELKVLVDTVTPRLDLFASPGPAGEVVVRWKSLDPHLLHESLKLEYQSGPGQPWETLAIEPPKADNKLTVIGESSWWPKNPTGQLLVRASISDRAGNVATTQAQVDSNQLAAAMPGGAGQGAGAASQTTPPNGFAAGPPPAGNGPGSADASPGGVQNFATSWPADRTSTQAPSALPETGVSPFAGAAGADSPSPWRPMQDRALMEPPTDLTNPNGAGGRETVSTSTSASPPEASSIQPTARGKVGRFDFSVVPKDQRVRMVNSRGFELEYELEQVGPSGVSKVELWGTPDGGKNWSVFGVDKDNRSPAIARTPGEGVYGFSVVVHGGNGFGGWAPKAGDAPEFWVGVDLTKPLARITAADPGRDAQELVIRWKASDDLIEARPIALFMSERSGTGWQPIASNLENTGSYVWRSSTPLPAKVYLKLEVRDEAGNIGTFETAEPIMLDQSRPQGKIRGVRPVLGRTPARTRMG